MKLDKHSLMKNEGVLDKIWRSVGKENAYCEICATLPVSERVNYTQLHPHHIIGRDHKATRWDLQNRLWVCPTHHTMGGTKKIVQDNLGGWFLNWNSDKDWMGRYRKKDKEHLRRSLNITKYWTEEELFEIYEHLNEQN